MKVPKVTGSTELQVGRGVQQPKNEMMIGLIASLQSKMYEQKNEEFGPSFAREIKSLSIGDSLEMFYAPTSSQLVICGWVIAVAIIAAVAQFAEALAGRVISLEDHLPIQKIEPSGLNLNQLLSVREESLKNRVR